MNQWRILRRRATHESRARFCPHCGQPREGDLRCQAAATSWTWAGPTACRAAVLQGLSEARIAVMPAMVSGPGDSKPRSRSRPGLLRDTTSVLRGNACVFRRSLSQDEKRLCPTPRFASARRGRRDFLGALGEPARAGQRARARHPARPEFKLDLYVNFRPVQLLHRPLAAARTGRSTSSFSARIRGPIPRPRSLVG